MSGPSDLVQGTLDLLLLKIVAAPAIHPPHPPVTVSEVLTTSR